MKRAWIVLASFGCAGAREPSTIHPPPADDSPCARLCDDEARCGSTEKSCRSACARDEAILRSSVVADVVDCRTAALKTTCVGPRTAFSRGDLFADTRCLSVATQRSKVGDGNRRAWSEASCDRMLRCQTKDADVDHVRPICVASTMAPKEQEEKEAMLVVDALRPEVIARWSECLTKGACPQAGKADAVAEACLAQALRRK